MKKVILALVLVGSLDLANPGPAAAHVSFSFAFPGFAFSTGPYPGPPVVYAPPAYYYPYYYPPAPVYGVTYVQPGFTFFHGPTFFHGRTFVHGHGFRHGHSFHRH